MNFNPQLSLRFELFVSALRRKRGAVFQTSRGAINGYDVVAYFTEGRVIPGKKLYAVEWSRATWYFCGPETKEEFKQDPERYAPQFGGFCAYGVHNGYKIQADPRWWTIHDGKLYLNYNERVQTLWRSDPKACIAKAEQNWGKLKKKWW